MFFKSVIKGVKYVGLTFAAAGVGGVASEFLDVANILIQAGVPDAIAQLIGGLGAQAGSAFLAVLAQQILKHRSDAPA